MFAYIKGVLAAKGQDYIVVETGSIGYRIVVPTNTFEKLNSIGSKQEKLDEQLTGILYCLFVSLSHALLSSAP
jgi:Holliday junction resolvasome RuvABC DNA-binding subunit